MKEVKATDIINCKQLRRHKANMKVIFGISKLFHFVYRHELKKFITVYLAIDSLNKHTYFMPIQKDQ